MKKTYILAHQVARDNAVKAVSEAPYGFEVTIQPPKRSNDQNSKLHAALTDYGHIIGWKFNGSDVDLDDLKTIFVAAYRKSQNQQARFVIGFDGQPIVLNWRSRDMRKAECAELIDMIECEIATRMNNAQ